MAGLRERQKADRNRRMLEAAAHLFREVGYHAARIEDIAAAAEVSAGTIYNYFGTKGDVLLSLVTMEVEEVLDEGAVVVARPPADARLALDRLISVYYDHSLVYLTKDLWRRAMALSIEAPETPFSARYTALDQALCEQVTALLRQLQGRDLLRRDADAGQVGAAIFAMLNQLFMDFVRDETMSIDQLKAISAGRVSAIALLLAPPGKA